MVISDAACTALSTAGVPLELDGSAGFGTQMPLAEAMVVMITAGPQLVDA